MEGVQYVSCMHTACGPDWLANAPVSRAALHELYGVRRTLYICSWIGACSLYIYLQYGSNVFMGVATGGNKDAMRNRCSKCIFFAACSESCSRRQKYVPWQIQHIPFSCKQGSWEPALFSHFLSSDSLYTARRTLSAQRERDQHQQHLWSHRCTC
jgi:hypothetical protein